MRVPFKRQAVLQLQLRVHQAWPVWVLGSENHLLQVLVNILLNARDASETGVERCWSPSPDEDGFGSMRIQDFGEGIDEVNLAKIFDPFFTTKEVDRGTGLGLAVSHGIVERHRGHDHREEVEVGEGTAVPGRSALCTTEPAR